MYPKTLIFSIFTVEKNLCILHGQVFVMKVSEGIFSIFLKCFCKDKKKETVYFQINLLKFLNIYLSCSACNKIYL